jgi:hypothetical protein
MILKKQLDGKDKMILNGKKYWLHYQKMPSVLGLIKLIKEQIEWNKNLAYLIIAN